MKLHLISLGCARNLVDSEMMLGMLLRSGWSIADDPSEAEAIVVNTCSFIESAADESIDVILEAARYKKIGVCRCLVVAGCLPQRYGKSIVEELPEVDCFLGTGALHEIAAALDGCRKDRQCLLPDPDSLAPFRPDAPRRLTTGSSAYLKIAEGCSRRCTYCIIPSLRGAQKSRPPEEIASEARSLSDRGVSELVLVAQDTTAYGKDLDPPESLPRLLELLSEAFSQGWIRLLYGHPESIDRETIEAVGRLPNLCPYFDIPIQHASDPVLRAMGRRYTNADLRKRFASIREMVPDASLRTTVIVGFPGETKEDFRRLTEFVREIRFDHLGVFIYSDAEDLPSYRLPGKVAHSVARSRRDRIMLQQKAISEENIRKYLGTAQQALVEEEQEPGLYVGRTRFQAPEVDGVTYIKGSGLATGRFVRVRISDATEYDLSGEAI